MTLDDSVASPRRLSGRALREGFFRHVPSMSLGLGRVRGTSLFIGPLEIIGFGRPKTTRTSVELPIERGLAVGAPGGHLRIESAQGRLKATVEGYRPRLPRAIYALTQLPFHHAVMRLFLLAERGRLPMPGMPAPATRRAAAAAIDIGLCAAAAMIVGRRRRLVTFAGIAIGYHIACWTLSGRTIGGSLLRQRVVSVDGSRLSAGQGIVRLLALPLAALRMRAVHDEVAGTEVIAK